jgi:hypothetical protein
MAHKKTVTHSSTDTWDLPYDGVFLFCITFLIAVVLMASAYSKGQ